MGTIEAIDAFLADGMESTSGRGDPHRRRGSATGSRVAAGSGQVSRSRAALAQGRGLADAVAQEVELARRTSPWRTTSIFSIRGRDLERPLDTDAGGDAADGDGPGDATAAQAHDGPFEDLDALAVALDDLGRHLHGVTGGELRRSVRSWSWTISSSTVTRRFLDSAGQPWLREGIRKRTRRAIGGGV